MPLAGFEPAIPTSEWPQTHALDRAATGIGDLVPLLSEISRLFTNVRIITNTNCYAIETQYYVMRNYIAYLVV